MKKVILNRCKKGFTLLEMTIVLIIITILTSAAIPSLTQNYLNKVEQKVSMDINNIQNAALAYYVQKNAWPTSITPTGANPPTDLESNGFLPSGWNAMNPFGNLYTTSLSGSVFTVSTQVANGTQTTIINQLPTSSYSGDVVSSSLSPPGSQSVMPTGTVIAWPSSTLPAGFLLCDGSVYSTASYPNLSAILGSTYGGNGTTTFAVPDLRGRFVLGQNGLTSNDGSTRVWSTDNFSNNQGNAQSYNVNVVGAISGEEKHRQTVVELAPHAHEEQGYGWGGGSYHPLRYSDSNQTGAADGHVATMSAGGNGDGTGLGAAANIVPPSMTMVYIIKD
jgi:prepilin-type N-terminal cleavage/methylation domain-containing protein